MKANEQLLSSLRQQVANTYSCFSFLKKARPRVTADVRLPHF